MRIVDTKHGNITLFKGSKLATIKFLVTTEGWREAYIEAILQFIEAESIAAEQLTEPQVLTPWEFRKAIEPAMKQFNKDLIYNWNRFTTDWPSPTGITPLYKILEH